MTDANSMVSNYGGEREKITYRKDKLEFANINEGEFEAASHW